MSAASWANWSISIWLSALADFCPDELKLSGSSLAGLMHSVLEREACFRFRAKGYSMSPFIRHRDVLTISRSLSGKPATGDVAAVFDPATGRAIVHRIVARTAAGVMLKGDNCHETDGLFVPSAVIGIVVAVERDGKNVWFGGGPEKRLIAFLSRTKMQNVVLLPLLRRIKSLL